MRLKSGKVIKNQARLMNRAKSSTGKGCNRRRKKIIPTQITASTKDYTTPSFLLKQYKRIRVIRKESNNTEPSTALQGGMIIFVVIISVVMMKRSSCKCRRKTTGRASVDTPPHYNTTKGLAARQGTMRTRNLLHLQRISSHGRNEGSPILLHN